MKTNKTLVYKERGKAADETQATTVDHHPPVTASVECGRDRSGITLFVPKPCSDSSNPASEST
jgi:hypothetical protein